jgi:hypothetical protein
VEQHPGLHGSISGSLFSYEDLSFSYQVPVFEKIRKEGQGNLILTFKEPEDMLLYYNVFFAFCLDKVKKISG